MRIDLNAVSGERAIAKLRRRLGIAKGL